MVIAAICTFVVFASSLLDGVVPWALLLGLRLMLSGVALLSAGLALHPGEAGHLRRTMTPLALVAVPAVWIAIQILPLGFAANPVWASASAALPHGALGHITVDVQATLFSLFGLLLAALIAMAVAAQTIERVRAEIALISLAGAAILFPTFGQAANAFGFPTDEISRYSALDCLILAAMLALACGTLAYERYETRHSGDKHARSRMLAIEGACAAVILCCVLVAEIIGGTTHLVAALGGLLVFASIVGARRFGWGSWFVIAALAVLAFVFVSLQVNGFGSTQAVLRGGTAANDIERQLMRDAPWAGIGAGAAPVFSNLYRTLDDSGAFVSSSAANKMIVELGAPACWVLIVAAIILEFSLVRDALRRGRDSIYPTLGAAFVPSVAMMAFANVGLFDWKVIVLIAGTIGLALCQSQSRTIAR